MISPGAVVIWSLVHSHAQIDDGSVVIRSIIGPYCVINASVIDRSVFCDEVKALGTEASCTIIGNGAVVINSSLIPQDYIPVVQLRGIPSSIQDRHEPFQLLVNPGSRLRGSGPIVGSNVKIASSIIVGPFHINPAQVVFRGESPTQTNW